MNWKKDIRFLVRGMGHQPTPIILSSPKGFSPREYEGGCRRCNLRIWIETEQGRKVASLYAKSLLEPLGFWIPKCPKAPKELLITLPEE